MVKPLSLVVVAMLALSVPAGAQEPPPPPAPPPAGQEQQPPPPPPPPAPRPGTQEPQKPPPPPPPPPPGDLISRQPEDTGPNVRVEVTLSERASGVAPKTVMVTTSSGHWGRVRTQVRSRSGGFPLNVDVKPWVLANGSILLELRVEYQQGNRVDDGSVRSSELNEMVTVRLQDGKPLAVTRSADADSDRSVSLEVKATVLK